MKNNLNGWINLHKPLHITSTGAVNKVKWLLKPMKIGHAGTLDPLATGILPLALGEGTKCINLLMDAKKTYEFSVTFGERRSTEDAEGEVIATSDHLPDEAAIRAVLSKFTGEILQTPPAYSALKVDGQRAYDLARAGEQVELKARPVTVYSLELLGIESETSEALSPRGRGLGEGALMTRKFLPEEQRERHQTYAKDLRRDATDVEQILWKQLRNNQMDGLKFKRQQPIDDYIVDFVCFEKRLIIELDGGQHTAEKDAVRTAYLESQGFELLRFWNHDVVENLDGVWGSIRDRLHRPLTQPSPARGEGLRVAHFRTQVSKGSYIRSLGRDIAQFLGSEGYISRLHRSAVGAFTEANAISLDFLEESVHKAPPLGDVPGLLPLHAVLDDIPVLALNEGQWKTLRYGQQVTLTISHPDTSQIAVTYQGQLAGLARVEGNQLISNRLLNVGA